MKKKKCYIYTRVSTLIQTDGYSLDAQKDKLMKYAAYQDMEIVGEYSEKSVIVGIKSRRLLGHKALLV